jgi:hypothetical protein
MRRNRTLGRSGSAVSGVLALAGVFALSGCGGDAAGDTGIATAGGTAAPTASATPSLSAEQAGLKFAQCMRAHGVDMPDPQVGSGGGMSIRIQGRVSPQTVQKAQQACKQYMPQLGGSRGPGKLDAAAQERALKFAKCMRDNGVDMPDPDFSGGGVRIRAQGGGSRGAGQGPNPDDPTFQKALKACRSLLGGDGGFSVHRGPQ